MAESQLNRWAEIVFLSLSKTVPELAWRQPDLRLFAGRVSTVTGWLVWAWLVSGGLDPPKSEAQGYSSQCLLLSPTWWYEYWLVLQVSQLMKKKTQVRGTGAFWACTSFLVCSALTCLPARSLVLVSHRNTTLHTSRDHQLPEKGNPASWSGMKQAVAGLLQAAATGLLIFDSFGVL